MSSPIAIASVTRLLKDLLNDVVVTADLVGQLANDVVVSALPPDKAEALQGEAQPSRLNLFLHRITPNAALSNSDLPTRDGRGMLVARPRLAVDLHYLITAYGTQELQTEVLLGHAMMVFHEVGLMPRDAVRAALKGGGAIPVFDDDDPARLAEQIELIKITPQNLSLDDMSKVWTSLQTNYRTTVAYLVSVVLMERELPVRTPLPVLSRGAVDAATGRDAGVAVRPDLTPSTPMITRATPAGDRPAMRLGDTITFSGFHLDAGQARVRFTEAGMDNTLELTPIAPPTSQRLQVVLPQAPLPANSPLAGTGADPDAWRIGGYVVDIEFETVGGQVRRTNRVALSLAPRVLPAAAVANNQTRITVTCAPQIRAGQSVAIVAGQAEQILPVPVAALTSSVVADFDDLEPGASVPVRLTVAGVDSLLIDPVARPPRFDPSQMVIVP